MSRSSSGPVSACGSEGTDVDGKASGDATPGCAWVRLGVELSLQSAAQCSDLEDLPLFRSPPARRAASGSSVAAALGLMHHAAFDWLVRWWCEAHAALGPPLPAATGEPLHRPEDVPEQDPQTCTQERGSAEADSEASRSTSGALSARSSEEGSAAAGEGPAEAEFPHERGRCKPCFYNLYGACSFADSCRYCHMPHMTTKWRRPRPPPHVRSKLKAVGVSLFVGDRRPGDDVRAR